LKDRLLVANPYEGYLSVAECSPTSEYHNAARGGPKSQNNETWALGQGDSSVFSLLSVFFCSFLPDSLRQLSYLGWSFLNNDFLGPATTNSPWAALLLRSSGVISKHQGIDQTLRSMLKLIGFFVFICSAGPLIANDREFGHPLFRTFTAHDYGELGQILAVTQDSQGRMLFGCGNNIAAFDNTRWERTPVPGTGYIRSLEVDNQGRVWFISSTQIGYFYKTNGGYHAVKVYGGSFGNSCAIIVEGAEVYASTSTGLLIWTDGQLSRRPWPKNSIVPESVTLFRGKISVGDVDGATYELEGDGFKRIAQPSSIDGGPVEAIVDCPVGDGLIVRSSGIFRKAGPNLVPWKSEIDSLFKDSTIFSAKWILGKYLAVLVQNRGIYVLDREGQLVESFTLNSGLADAGFEAVGEDRDGGLWVCTDTEITRIQCGVGCTEFDHQSGLPGGFITDVVRYEGKIYASTQHGAYVLKMADEKGETPHFIPFGERNERFYGMLVTGSDAFVYGNSGTYSLNSSTSTLSRIGSGSITISPSTTDPSRLFLSTRVGLEAVRNINGQWFSEGLLSDFPYAIEGMEGDGNGDLLVSTENDGFYRIQLEKNAQPLFRDAKIERLLDERNNPVASGNGSLCFWRGKTLFVGNHRVWQLKERTDRLESFESGVESLPSSHIFSLQSSRVSKEYIWVISRPPDAGPAVGFEVGRLYMTGYEPLSHAITYPLGIVYDIWEDNSDREAVAWIAGDYGLMRVVLNRPTSSSRKFELYASRILSANGRILPVRKGGGGLTLKYNDRDFEIRFGTDQFSAGNDLYYQARLEGKINRVSPASPIAVWRSGALDEGKYVLHVRARDSDGVESKEYVFGFVIEPPWYRSAPMVIALALLMIVSFYFFGRLRTWQMRRRERDLVQLVKLRTQEVRQNEAELRNAKDAAEMARENAERANRAKTTFLANMSHELRTPINSILGYSQILLRRLDDREQEKAQLRTILSSGEHLLEMINEVLDLSRVESGRVSVTLRPVELPNFIAGIVDEFQVRASRCNLTFVNEIDDTLPQWIETDPVRLRQVLYNVLGNAMKFTDQGEVALKVYATPEVVHFEVRDTGRGIPQDDLPSIFKPFYQATNNDVIGQGVGLGLHISKQIVELLGGRISVASEIGNGSRFALEFARRDREPLSHESDSRQVIGYAGRRRKILIVDDETLNRSLLRELLGMVGFETTEASSAQEAFSLLKENFDAVISDIRMPDCDGHTFCQNIRSSAGTKDLIVIASSASVFADDQRRARASGFTDFLPKPILEEELFDILKLHLELKWIYGEP
jgi:signal transduction histidine kinase/CheY-like chemotaxis protein